MPFDFDDDDTMPVEQLKGPVLAVRARVRLADFRANSGAHRFGGPLAMQIGGAVAEPPILNRVLTLSLSDPLVGLSIADLAELPLVYGFTYSGCRLKYRVASDSRIELLEMSPGAPSADWPYTAYPTTFPEKRFGLRDDGTIEPEQVHELTWQGVRSIDPAEGVVAIVPPSKKYGVSLWGDGDDELVQVVFEIDPKARTVAVYNQCG